MGKGNKLTDTELGMGRTCFIVSPIGNRLDPRGTEGRTRYEDNVQMWAEVLEPACEELGLSPIRADKIAHPGEITEQIFVYLRDADVVIADLSGANPNVMYELGLRHTRDKLTIQIGEYGRLPFDVNTIRTIQFTRTEAGRIDARNSLINALRAGLEGKGSPVAATRVWNDAASPAEESVAKAVQQSKDDDDDPDPVAEEPGMVDILADGEEAISEISGVLTEAGGLMTQMGSIATASKVDLDESDRRGKGFAGRLHVVRSMARELEEPARLFEEYAGQYIARVTTVNTMVEYVLDRLEADPDELQQSRGFLLPVLGLVNAADTSAVSLTGFAAQVVGLRKVSKDLSPVSKTIEKSLNRFLQGNGVISGWRERVEAAIDQLLDEDLGSDPIDGQDAVGTPEDAKRGKRGGE